MSKFKQLKSDIYAMIMKEISNSISCPSNLTGLKPIDGETISKCSRLLVHLDEATIKYLMKLTNDYIRAKKEQDEVALKADLSIFAKYGFDATILDDKINEIQWPYKDMWKYDTGNEMWPNKIQEEIMGIVFSCFECPEKMKLPRVDKILERSSKFGVIEHNSGEIMWLDTRHFDDPYDTCGYFSTAIRNGLSIDEIIQYRKEIDTYMDYYSAPRMPGRFNNPRFRESVTEVVGNLEEDQERMSKIRAEKVYKAINFQLNQANQQLNAQLAATAEATAYHGKR